MHGSRCTLRSRCTCRQARAGQAAAQGPVPVSSGSVGTSPVGSLAEAVAAQILSPHPAPLPVGCCPSPHTPSLLYGL